jgi:hypothetical protein
MLELPHTDFAVCLHTCAIQHQTQNPAQMFTRHSRVRSLTLQCPLQCEATSPSAVCAMMPTQQTTKKTVSTSYHKEMLRLVPSRFNFIQPNGFSTSVRLLFPSSHSKTSGGLATQKIARKTLVREVVKNSGSRLFLGLKYQI